MHQPGKITKHCRNLFERLFEKDPAKRISKAEEIMKHEFFKEIDWDKLARKEGKTPIDLTKKIKGWKLPEALKGNADVSMVSRSIIPILKENPEWFAEISQVSQAKK